MSVIVIKQFAVEPLATEITKNDSVMEYWKKKPYSLPTGLVGMVTDCVGENEFVPSLTVGAVVVFAIQTRI